MSSSSSINTTTTNHNNTPIEIELEIVSDEEMAFLEAALSSARSFLSSSSATTSSRLAVLSALPSVLAPCRRQVGSLPSAAQSLTSTTEDIEDSAGLVRKVNLLDKFRSRRGLSVTDITATEWCEKQMEFVLLRGKPKKTLAMKAGSKRHTELEKEVIERVEIRTKSIEDSWAVKFLNFIAGSNQLLFEGLTRELPVVGVVQGVWIVGVIDELRMPVNEATLKPVLVDTKTRYKATVPSEAQKRNARLQLMCYKYLWDSLVDAFPINDFFNRFDLNPQYILSEDVKQYSASLGFNAQTFEDVVIHFRDACCLLPPSQDQLLLRYELQSDHSLLEEYQFAYDAAWFKDQVDECFKFWMGDRDANYVSDAENWKCHFCTFTTTCPATSKSNDRAG